MTENQWPADKVERRAVADLVPYVRNARTHSDEQVGQIAASIKEWGWTVPVLVDEDGGIIAGHGRILAAQRLGIEDVPCMVAQGWTEAQRKAYVIADNKLALNAGWDDGMLGDELQSLQELGFEIGLTGFSDAEFDALVQDEIEPDGLTDDDAVPATGPEPISGHGMVWQLGDHRVMCGDSLDLDSVQALCAGQVDAVWTDPPYNVNYESKAGKIKNDHMKDEAFRKFLRDAFVSAYAVMRPGAPIYVAHADTEGFNFRGAFCEAGFKMSGCLVWVKSSLVLGRSDYQWRHEPILYGWKEGAAHSWYGGRAKTTVADADDVPFTVQPDGSVLVESGGDLFRITGEALEVEALKGSVVRCEKPKRSAEHPTMKPVALVLGQMKNSTKRGDVVLDLFGGSGTTLIACHKSGRHARLMEFDPKYCDVIVRRWQEFTGREAIREEDGRTFAELEAERCKVA